MPTLETDQYIKREERRKLEKIRAEVRCVFVHGPRLGGLVYSHPQMERKKTELVCHIQSRVGGPLSVYDICAL